MTKPRAEAIISQQEALALTLLKRASGQDVNLDIQLDVFEKIAKWVAIRNRVEDDGDTRIDEFKRRISGESEADQPDGRSARRQKRDSDKLGPRLAQLKGRVSGAGDGGSASDLNGAGGEAPPVA